MSSRPNSPSNGTTDDPVLPLEIIDTIINVALEGAGERALQSPTASAIALTSHRCRIHVNRQRFSKLGRPFQMNCYRPIQEHGWIKTLASVVRSHQASVPRTMGCILDFVTSFHLHLISTLSIIESVLDSEDCTFLMDNLFRVDFGAEGFTKPTYHFNFLIGIMDATRGDRVHWNTMNPLFRESFLRLLRSSNINQLSIYGVGGIPRCLLRGSSIRHLTLCRVSTSDSEVSDAEIIGVNHNAHLPSRVESLVISFPVSWPDVTSLVSSDQVSNDTSLSRLLHLEINLIDNTSINTLNTILTQTPDIKSLSIHNFRKPNLRVVGQTPPPPRYNHLRSLQSLTICSYRYDWDRYYPNPVTHFLQTPPPSLDKLCITLKMGPNTWETPESMIKHLDELDINPPLAMHLAGRSFRWIRRIVFNIELNSAKHKGGSSDTSIQTWKLCIKERMCVLFEKRTGVDVVITTM